MKIAVRNALGTAVLGRDGHLGRLHDLLFDDRSWAIRYLTIQTGRWLPGRKVVLLPTEVMSARWPENEVEICKTRQEIEESPPLAEHEPISLQHESEIADYFDWPRLWGGADPLGPDTPMGVGEETKRAAAGEEGRELAIDSEGDPHLRSSQHVLGYDILAEDGDIGQLDDLILDDQEWQLRYLVVRVDPAKWFKRPSFLVAPEWIHSIDWESRSLQVDLSRGEIRNCPAFDPSQPVNRRLEEQLYDYYGRRRYWKEES